MNDDIDVRALLPADWAAYKAMRLHALRTEEGLFFSAYEAEQGLTDDEWRERTQNPNRQMFGVFDGERLIGITGVQTARGDASGASAMLISSYLLPEYRGRGITRLMYDARLAWIRAQGRYTRVEVSHRRSNEPSMRAIRRAGFVPTTAAAMTWPDGTVEDEVQYELLLRRDRDGVRLATMEDEYREAFDAMLEEYRVHGESGLFTGFYAAAWDGYDAYRAMQAKLCAGGWPTPEIMPGAAYFVMNGDDLVGEVFLRYRLTPALEQHGGNIGYQIRPRARNRGFATQALRLALERLRDTELHEALLTCATDNVASRRVMEKCAGRRIADSAAGGRRYVIPLSAVVRPATPDDAAEACAVIRDSIVQLCELDHGNDPQHLDRWLSNKTPEQTASRIRRSRAFVAERWGLIDGVAAMDDTGKVNLNYVAPRARFSGVSKMLMARLEETARSLGLDALKLESSKTAVRFYEALGFVRTAETYHLPLTGTAAIVMVKRLHP